MLNCQRPAFSISPITILEQNVLSWRLRRRRSRVAPPHLLSVAVAAVAVPRTRDFILEAWKRVALLLLGSVVGTRFHHGDSYQLVRPTVDRYAACLFTTARPESRPPRHTATAQ